MSLPRIYEDTIHSDQGSPLRSCTMSTPSSGSAGNGAGDERFDPGDLGSISEIQQQLVVRSRQMGQLAACFIVSERQRVEEAANVAAIQAAQKPKKSDERGGKSRVERSYDFLAHNLESFGGEVRYYCCWQYS